MNRACTNVPTCYFGGTKSNNHSNNMEQSFKLDLTQLTPVEEKDRVKGNYYVAADNIDPTCTFSIRRWHSQKYDMNQGGECSLPFANWLAIPPNLPGFPVAELPDELELKWSEWEIKEFINPQFLKLKMDIKFRRIKHLPELTIPSGTRAEQVAKLKELLVDFETF
jgi:hypothetical protein